jgi:hypothetical protein
MSNNDNEIAEQGDKREDGNREFSVLGDTVYEKNWVGNWKEVDDPQARGAAGEKTEDGASTYSRVGDTVYEKTWVGNWREVDDPQRQARAGEKSESSGSEYSTVGDIVYRKNLFGNWDKVTDEQEQADARYTKNVNGTEYSVVGDQVYRKNLVGIWVEEQDDQKQAEAGRISKHNRSEYSTVGNTTYRKTWFGNWEKLNEEEARVIENEIRSTPHHDQDYKRAGGSYSASSRNSSSSGSSSESRLTGIFLFFGALFLAGLYFWLMSNHASYQQQQTQQLAPVVAPQEVETPAPQDTQQVQTPAAPANPYGEGNGRIAIYIDCYYCGTFQAYEDTVSLGTVPAPQLAANRGCDAPDILPVILSAGQHTITIKKGDGQSWQQTVQVPLGDCVMVKAERPPDTTENEQQTTQIEQASTRFELLSPENHSSYGFPRYTDVRWRPFDGADSYIVELQLSNSPYNYSATSYSPMPYSNKGFYSTTQTAITVQGMGKQVHRVRVLALSAGQTIAITTWRYFDYSD